MAVYRSNKNDCLFPSLKVTWVRYYESKPSELDGRAQPQRLGAVPYRRSSDI